MAKDFDRRTLLHGGCALFAVGCAGAKATDAPPGHTGDPTTDPTTETGGATPFADYPCDQTDTPDGGWTELTFTQYPDLATPGGWYPVTVGGRSLVVAHVVEGCFAAVSRPCTHEGEPVNYVPARAQFTCPRHGAVYAADGGRVSGPQPASLENFPCVQQGSSVFVRA